jgi:hypothetical protein
MVRRKDVTALRIDPRRAVDPDANAGGPENQRGPRPRAAMRDIA